ncbi:helix-turn-helix domain-containing protein [Macrococcus animalis]|uniref:helix-turn-helix domain-containing protein n=1 Tax=Macrococcus animalis TaxID=3395467 RepID=UPI0039BE84F7
MKYDAIDIVKENGIHLLGVQLLHFKLVQVSKIKRYLATPFTNTRSKQYQNNVETFIKGMRVNTIYHYKNHFNVNYFLFKRNKDKSVIIIGPFLEQRPSEKECHEMLQEANLQISKVIMLKQYLLQIPLCHYKKALTYCRLATKFILERKQLFDVEKVAFRFHRTIDENIDNKHQIEFSLAQVEHRYNIENQLLISIEKGDVESAFKLISEIQILVSGLQRSKNDIANARYKTTLLNTLSRKALEKAGVNVLMIDEISARYAKMIDDVLDVTTLDEIARDLVIEYAELANKTIAMQFSPIVSKVIQYIELHLDHSLTLNELAENVNVSPNYLSNIFNKEVNTSISQFINQMRVSKAVELIERTSMSMRDIAQYVGFKNQSYFTKCFKLFMGTSPLQYKKKIKQ